MKSHIIRELKNDKDYCIDTIKALKNIEIKKQKNGKEYKNIKTALAVNGGMKYNLNTGKYPSITIYYPGSALTIDFYSFELLASKKMGLNYLNNFEIREKLFKLISEYERKAEDLQKQIDDTEKAIDCFRTLKEDFEKVTGGKNELYKKILENAKYI